MAHQTRQPFPGSGLATNVSRTELFDLGAIMMVLRRRAWLFAIVAALVAAAVIAFYTTLEKSYSATAQVAINTQRSNVIAANQEVLTEDQPTTFAIDTQVEVLRSRDLARRVVQTLRLDRNADFVPEPQRADPAAATQAATDTLLRNLGIARSGVAFAINVSYNAGDPNTAATVVNTLVQQYLDSQLTLKTDATQSATDWLGTRLASLRAQVLTAETAVQRYRAANGLLATARDEIGSQQQLGQISTTLAAAEADLAEKQAAATTAREQARGVNAGEDVGQALTSDVIVQLRRQRGEIGANVAQLESRYGPRYPELLSARSQLQTIDAQIAAEVRRIISGLEGEARIAADRVGSLRGTLNSSRGELAANSAASVRLSELERNADAVRTLYESYLARYRQTSTQSGLESSDARILSQAVVPTKPSSPKLSIFLVIALAAGLASGATAVALSEILDRSLRTPDAILTETGLRTLASVPSFESAFPGKASTGRSARELIAEHPFSAFTESLRMLRAGLNDGQGAPPKVVTITSALPGEGKSTVAASLAHVAALGGERVVLVECDTRRGVGASVPDRPDHGLLEVLGGAVPLDAALQVDAQSGLATLPLSRQVLRPADAVAAGAMDDLLAELRRRYDLVILDTAPVMAIAETRLLAAKSDAVCMLVRWGKTPANAAVTSVRLLHESGVNLAGAVLSHVDLRKQANWSQNDPSAYFKTMKEYYG